MERYCEIWGEKAINPYIAEIDGEEVEQVICSRCYDELCNDI
jgi:hypothetical protein